jgi:hypothetical protein
LKPLNLLAKMHITFNLYCSKLAQQTIKLCVSVGLCIVALGVLTGCTFNPFQRQTVAVAPPAPDLSIPTPPTALTDEAARALAIAEKNVADARVAFVLWTAASEKLAAAKRAAVVFDSATVIRIAREVDALCLQSAAQAKYPLVTW